MRTVKTTHVELTNSIHLFFYTSLGQEYACHVYHDDEQAANAVLAWIDYGLLLPPQLHNSGH